MTSNLKITLRHSSGTRLIFDVVDIAKKELKFQGTISECMAYVTAVENSYLEEIDPRFYGEM